MARTSPWLVRASRMLQLQPLVLAALGDKLDVLRGMLAPDFLKRFGERDPYRVFFGGFDYRTQLAGREPVKQILYIWLKSLFVNYNLARDRLGGAQAVRRADDAALRDHPGGRRQGPARFPLYRGDEPPRLPADDILLSGPRP